MIGKWEKKRKEKKENQKVNELLPKHDVWWHHLKILDQWEFDKHLLSDKKEYKMRQNE